MIPVLLLVLVLCLSATVGILLVLRGRALRQLANLGSQVRDLKGQLATAESLMGLGARLSAILSANSHTDSLLSQIIIILSEYLPGSTTRLVLFDADRGLEITGTSGGMVFVEAGALDDRVMGVLTTPGVCPPNDWAIIPELAANDGIKVLNIPILNEGFYAGSFLIYGTAEPDSRLRLLLTDLSTQIAAAFRDIMHHRENSWIKDRFGSLVDPRVRDHLLDRREHLAGELRDVTVLFLDIRNFTSFSESRPPAEVLGFLNLFFGRMEECIHATGGLINKFTGDGFLAVFGAPDTMADHAFRALQAAMLMRLRIASAYPDGSLRVGMGISSGCVAAGKVGSLRRMEYSVIGDVVNLASRLEGMSKHFGAWVVFDSPVLERIEPHAVRFRPLGKVKVKGRTESGHMFELLSCRSTGLAAEALTDAKDGGEWLESSDAKALLDTSSDYEAGIKAWWEGDFAQTLRSMEAVLLVNPRDPAALQYLEQARRHLADAPPSTWEGVIGFGS